MVSIANDIPRSKHLYPQQKTDTFSQDLFDMWCDSMAERDCCKMWGSLLKKPAKTTATTSRSKGVKENTANMHKLVHGNSIVPQKDSHSGRSI